MSKITEQVVDCCSRPRERRGRNFETALFLFPLRGIHYPARFHVACLLSGGRGAGVVIARLNVDIVILCGRTLSCGVGECYRLDKQESA